MIIILSRGWQSPSHGELVPTLVHKWVGDFHPFLSKNQLGNKNGLVTATPFESISYFE
jgi:hypothetical protein